MKRVSKISAATLAIGLLSACASSGFPETRFGEMIRNIFPQFERMTEEGRREAERSKAWNKLTHRTTVQAVGDDRLEIEARGALGNGIQKVEDTFLTRAAAETVREGYDGFLITYLTYESEFPISFTNGFTSFPETVEISTYEEFLSYSKEQRIMVSAGAMNFKRIKGVIVMVKDADHRHGTYFDADDLFENFIVAYQLR